MSDESMWIERAQSAEAKLSSLNSSTDRMKEEVREVYSIFCARRKGDGSVDIDFPKFVERMGLENALMLRKVIDDVYSISGSAGEKPKIKLKAAR